MHMKRTLPAALLASFALTGFSSGALALDVEAAKSLADQNNCMQCHGLRKDKDGPSFLKTAERLRGKPNATDEVIKHLTSGKEVKLADGSKEKHTVAKTMPANDMAQMRNLAAYILSIQPK
jgi:cytochrome c